MRPARARLTVTDEFLDKDYRTEPTTFADGTTVTLDWNANTFSVKPGR